METIINVLIDRHNRIRSYLEEKGEISLKTDSDNEFRKVLVLSISSYFESEITDALLNLARSTGSDEIVSLIRAKAISRQYHSLFAWDAKNINHFLKLLGESFKENVSAEISRDSRLDEGAKAFLKLGQKRNVLVHENFASVPIEWTTEEIAQLYKDASEFIQFLSQKISPRATVCLPEIGY
ncbi:MAG TPA: HEPN domain-containing protein [Candidatus Deferrimicrobium sp.]|nr:HEPN domain-containing protein [Candidatus Deferrimicrobium sp.]